MSGQYDWLQLKNSLLFSAKEILPTDAQQLDEEVQQLVALANQSGEVIRHYIGFEISGQIHLGTGIMTALTIKQIQEAGVRCSVWLANYHTWLNNKLDGTIDTISKFNRYYFTPVLQKCLQVVGCDVSQIDFWSAEELYVGRQAQGRHFWDFMMKVAKNLTLARVNKSITITGKQAGEGVEFGLLCYPVMQVADAFFMQTHIVHGGMDQRKCHVLMREVALKMDENFELKLGGQAIKPIAVHHPLLLSLAINPKEAGSELTDDLLEAMKMSKSKPDSAIWVHDNPEEITRKLKKAYCPLPNPNTQTPEEIAAEQAWNPILDWCQKMLYPAGKIISVRLINESVETTFNSFTELQQAYFAGHIHPLDLKLAVAKTLSDWLAPIREFVNTNQQAQEMLALLAKLHK